MFKGKLTLRLLEADFFLFPRTILPFIYLSFLSCE